MALDFPSSPGPGATYNAPNGVTYTWDNTVGTGVWLASAGGGGSSGVTSVTVNGAGGILTTGNPITTSGTIAAVLNIGSLVPLP